MSGRAPEVPVNANAAPSVTPDAIFAQTGWQFLEHRPLAGAVSLVVAER